MTDSAIKQIAEKVAKCKGFDVFERRPDQYQIIHDIKHGDGDMVDVYIAESPKKEELGRQEEFYVRICDFGMAVMRCGFQENEPSPEQIKAFINDCGLWYDEGNIYLDYQLRLGLNLNYTVNAHDFLSKILYFSYGCKLLVQELG